MKSRSRWLVALFLLPVAAGKTSAADTIPLAEATAPWMGLLKSGDVAVRNAAWTALADIIRKHPVAAGDVVKRMAEEENTDLSAEHERRLVPLSKQSPAAVSAFIRLIKDKGTNYRVRNFSVKVLSQSGPAAATPEFVEALAETYCPVPGSFFRIMRALGKDAAPILAAGYRHPNSTIRNRAIAGLRMIGRTEPTIQRLFEDLQAEPPLVQKIREGTPAERIDAIAALAELVPTTPGAATVLVQALKNVSDKDVLAEAEVRLITLGRGSHEVVATLVAAVRSEDDYNLRKLAVRVLPMVGSGINCKEMVEALGDQECPVPGAMRRILIAAGPDALPVLSVAQKHANSEIRMAAEYILKRMPKPADTASAVSNP